LAIGFVIAAGLAGSALAAVIVSFAADRFGLKRSFLLRTCDAGVRRNAEGHMHRSLGRPFPSVPTLAYSGVVFEARLRALVALSIARNQRMFGIDAQFLDEKVGR
jgi:hypothetical protein